MAGYNKTPCYTTVVHVVPSLEQGGLQRGLVNWLGLTSRDSWRHVVCTLDEAGPLAAELPSHVELASVAKKEHGRFAAVQLAHVIRRTKADLVHARNWPTWFDSVVACRLASRGSQPDSCAGRTVERHNLNRRFERRPQLVLGFHGLETPHGFSGRRRLMGRCLGLRKYHFTTVSQAARRQLSDDLGISPEQILTIANGIDYRQFKPASPAEKQTVRSKLGMSDDDFVIAMVGSLYPVKGHSTVIDALALAAEAVPRLRLLVAGDGPLRPVLQKKSANLPAKASIRWLGTVKNPVETLHAADIFVNASRYEQISHAVLEAMGCGLPMVVTAVGDHADIVGHGQGGLVVSPDDADALAHALITLASDDRRRKKFGAESRRRVARLGDPFRVAREYQRFYESRLRLPQSNLTEVTPCAESPVSFPIERYHSKTVTP